MDWPIKHVTLNEVKEEIKKLNIKKSPGYDTIDGYVTKSLPTKALILLTNIYNAILRLSHFPSQWKCAEIIMIEKPVNRRIKLPLIDLLVCWFHSPKYSKEYL
jgi:hypothetical protein